MQQIINMKFNTLQQDFLREMREHPNTTAFRLQDEIVTNALFTQRIAPIMNEFDTMPEQKLAMLVEEDLQNIAALPAALFSGKIMIPIRQSWSENQREQVLRKAGVETCLTAHRMQYYFRMTYEDALDRIDHGLYAEQITTPIALLYDFDKDGNLVEKEIFIEDIPSGKSLTQLVFDFCSSYK